MRDMHRFLRDGEETLALVRVPGMSIDLLLATSDRLTGWSSAGVSKGPKLAVLWSDVVDYRYVGMSEKLLVRRAAGDEGHLRAGSQGRPAARRPAVPTAPSGCGASRCASGLARIDGSRSGR
jgi:hypothetical protein